MTEARNSILRRLRLQARGEVMHPLAWETRNRFDDLAERFAESVISVGGEVFRVESLDAALNQLGDLLHDLGAAWVVVNNEPPLADSDLYARKSDLAWHVVGKSSGNLREFCAMADAGVSGAEAAFAETGTIVIGSGPGRSRLSTLLPPVHIALVGESQITADIFTWTAARGGKLPANVTLISGPSKTGDIEQVLAVGVHGPKRFIVILYAD